MNTNPADSSKTFVPADPDRVQAALDQADDDFANGRVRRFANETELRAFAEEIKANGRARMEIESTCAAIQEGLDDLNNGRVRPAADAIKEIRRQEFEQALAHVNEKFGNVLRKLAE